MCCNVSSPFVQQKHLCWTLTDITADFPKDVDLPTLSCFVLKLTNVYDNTNELSSVQKCAFQIPQRQFFLYTDYFKIHFSHILLILVTVRCTYWGPLWWRDSVILTVGKTILFFSFWICCCHSDDQKDTCDVHLSLCPAPVVSVSLYSPSPVYPLLVCVSLPFPSHTPLS